MIEWISHWLQGIILVVLLATFVDLLLPSSNMQKYSKIVLGLIVILSIITPIFEVFSKDFSFESITRSLENNLDTDANVPVMEMKNDDESVNQEYQKKMIEQVEISMEQHLTSILESRFQVMVQDVSLQAEIKNSQDWQIQHVQVIICEKDNSQQEQRNNEVKEIEKVEMVSINTEQKGTSQPSQKYEVNESPESQKLKSEIVQVIQEQWGIEKEKITVQIETNKGGYDE